MAGQCVEILQAYYSQLVHCRVDINRNVKGLVKTSPAAVGIYNSKDLDQQESVQELTSGLGGSGGIAL
jgi:hypothetical protein